MNQQGWIKIHRKLMDNKIWGNSDGLKVWLWCLLKASHNEIDTLVGRQNIHLDSGQFIFGRLSASEELLMSPSTIRNWINFLKVDSYLDIKSNNKYSIITIKNWIEYQNLDSKLDNKIKTNEKQIDTNKNDKNDKNIYNIYSSYKKLINGNSILTDKAKAKLKTRLKTYSEEQLIKAIDNFSKDTWRMENNSDKGVAWFFDNDDRIEQFMNMKPRLSGGQSLKTLNEIQIQDLKDNPEKLYIYKKEGYDTSRFIR